jgi:hypothetical protein
MCFIAINTIEDRQSYLIPIFTTLKVTRKLILLYLTLISLFIHVWFYNIFLKVTIKRVTIFGNKKKKKQRILKNSPINSTENESTAARKFQMLETLISPREFTGINSPKSIFNDLIDDSIAENAGISTKNTNTTREITKGSIDLDVISDV